MQYYGWYERNRARRRDKPPRLWPDVVPAQVDGFERAVDFEQPRDGGDPRVVDGIVRQVHLLDGVVDVKRLSEGEDLGGLRVPRRLGGLRD